MKTVLLVLALAFTSGLMAQSYDARKAHEDSLVIYNVYKDEIKFLENAAKTSNYQGWYTRSEYDDSATTCAKLRLKKWNHKEYEMADIREFEGFGTAYMFPKPAATKASSPLSETEAKLPAPTVDRKIKFSITDVQTKFITRPDGKTKTPYVEKINYNSSGRIVSVEQLYSMAN